jgi:TonB-linked SusC/RagA family outer membrane protein
MKEVKGYHLLPGKAALSFLLLFFSIFTFAQRGDRITGIVRDEKGVVLPGVNITVKGKRQGVVTDNNGSFVLDLTEKPATLIVSHAGYESQEVVADGGRSLDIRLILSNLKLDSVVVVGYGTQKKSTLTGAVASIGAGDLGNRPDANIGDALQGKIAGVNVTNVSGEPGSAPVIRIRGIGTINNNDPLIVVDGVPMDIGNSTSLNPETIDRVEVLKDASAAAIYGSRGSNGVVLITTKRGVAGKPKVSISAYTGYDQAIKKPDAMSSNTFYKYLTEAYANAGAGYSMPRQVTEQYQKGYSTDWFDQIAQKGMNQNYNLLVQGGTESYKYAINAGYLDEKGYIKGLDYSKMTVGFNNDVTVNSWLKLGNTLNVAFSQRTPAPNLLLASAYEADPFTPVINPNVPTSDPNYQFDKYAPTEYSYYPNPVGAAAMNFQRTNTFYVNGNIFLEVEPVKGLHLRSQFGIDKSYARSTNFLPSFAQVYDTASLQSNTQVRTDANREFDQNSIDMFNFTWNNTIRYDKAIGQHNFSVLGGYVLDKRSYETVNASVKGLPGNDPEFRILGAGTSNYFAGGSRYPQAIQSFIGRLNYDYAGRYLLTVNFRADGSSNFASGHQWGYFPAVSAGWKFTDEEFFKGWDQRILSWGKLRAGWGQTGNDAAYGAAATYVGVYGRYPFDGSLQQAYTQTSVGNPDIQWEKGQQTDIGLDAAFLENRLTLTADWYNKKTIGMILQVPTPYSAGYPSTPYVNAGNMSNKGYEITLGYNKHQGAFHYDVSVNFDAFQNKVLSLGNGNASFANAYGTSKTAVGKPVGEFYGAVFEGIFQTQQEIDNYVDKNGVKLQPNAQPGDMKFRKVLNDGQAIGGGDQDFIGSPFPTFSYGLTANFSYKNFDLGLFVQGVEGNKIWSIWQQELERPLPNASSFNDAYSKAWRGPGTSNYFPRLTMNLSDPNNNYGKSSWYVHDGSYLRMKNIQLGYTIPASTLRVMKMSAIRVYISATNLFTVTKYPGIDPEQGDPDPKNFGIDYVTPRIPKVFTLGLNVSF